MEIRELILKIVSEDKSILGRRDEFLKKLESYSPNPKDFAAIKRAVQSVNVAEMFLMAEGKSAEELETTIKNAREKLENIGLQESRVEFIIDAFKYSIDALNAELNAKLNSSDEPSSVSLEKPQNNYAPLASEPSQEETIKATQEATVGATVEEPKNTWICSCGKENDGNFCTKCGRGRDGNIPVNNLNSNVNASNSNAHSNFQIWFAVAVVCIVVVGFFMGTSLSGNEASKNNTAQTQTKEQVKNDKNDKSNKSANTTANPVQTEAANPTTAQAPSGKHWICDSNGVYLWNPEPTSGESITWSGSYVVDGGYKYADGRGIVEWYKNGQLEQIDEGQFIQGRHNGHFTHKFPKSGRVMYSNWDHGTELN